MSNRRLGTVFLVLLVAVSIGAGIAAKSISPNMITKDVRSKEERLNFFLSELRMAVTLERLTGVTGLFNSDWNNKANFVTYLNKLVQFGYLREIPLDPTLLPEKWGTSDEQEFWLPTRNYIASSGFEVQLLTDTVWGTGSQQIDATVSNNQSWSGDGFGGTGRSLVIIKK